MPRRGWMALALALAVLSGAAATAAAGLPGAPPTVGSATAAASGCPADLTRAATVPEGCPCLPIRNAAYGACEAGYVCAQPWALQVAQAARTSRTLLLDNLPAARAMRSLLAASSSGSGAGLHPDQAGGAAAGQPPAAEGFACSACSYGQLCPRGSALPPVLDSSIQLAVDALACPPGFYW